MKDRPQHLREAFNRHHGQASICSVSVMKLTISAANSVAPKRNLSVAEGFVDLLPMVVRHRGQLRAKLAQWNPDRPYDHLIAAYVRSQGILVADIWRGFD